MFKFKKAPSNRGLRHEVLFVKYAVVPIQKSPIKSGIKTLVKSLRELLYQIQKSPIKSGIKTVLVLPQFAFLWKFKKAPSNRGLRR